MQTALVTSDAYFKSYNKSCLQIEKEHKIKDEYDFLNPSAHILTLKLIL